MTTLGVNMSVLVQSETLTTPFDNTSECVYNHDIVAIVLPQHLRKKKKRKVYAFQRS